METKKRANQANYLKVIITVSVLVLLISGGAVWTFRDQIFNAGAKELTTADTEESQIEKLKVVNPKSIEEPKTNQKDISKPEPQETEEPQDQRASSQLDELEQIKSQRPKQSDAASLQLVKNYLTVTGGKEAHDRLINVVASGVIREGSHLRDFQLIETQDGKRHITYTWRMLGREHEEVYAFDGVQAWKQQLKPKYNDAQPFTGGEATHFITHRWLLQPFVLPSVAEYVFKYSGSARANGRRTHMVIGFGKKDERTWFYFDQEKFLLLRWGGYGPVADKEEPQDYSASRFKKVGDVLLPEELNLILENGVYGRVTFESIKANQSLDDVNFLMPKSTVPVLKQRPVQPR